MIESNRFYVIGHNHGSQYIKYWHAGSEEWIDDAEEATKYDPASARTTEAINRLDADAKVFANVRLFLVKVTVEEVE